jgi:single-stranded-DNA-specific exonuclease
MVAIRARLREIGYWQQRKEPNLLRYLDLVALGTIADMVPLRKDNRILVKFGMEEIGTGKRPGIVALKEAAGVLDRQIDTRAILFRLGPRINAAGRLGYAEESVELFTCDDISKARGIAHILEERNTERRSIEEVVYREAKALAERHVREQRSKVLVLASESWHRGILGIVASRIANDFYRPTVMISLEDGYGKGSARRIGDILLLDALGICKEWLVGYGGHQSAAGLIIRAEHLEPFRMAFENAVDQQIGAQGEFLRSLQLDVCLNTPKELTEGLVTEFEMFAPFGCENMEPVVALRDMRILEKRVVGENHLRLSVGRDDVCFKAIGFGMASIELLLATQKRWDLAFTPFLDFWNGRPQVQLRLLDIRPS